jgi:uncharacterized protein YcfL
MKKLLLILLTGALLTGCNNSRDMTMNGPVANNYLYMDIHQMAKGKVASDAIAQVHKNDLVVQDKNQVSFVNYWGDEKNGFVYCSSESPCRKPVVKTHTEARGQLPNASIR